jgi:iron complex outermembrane receptor protein
MHEVLEKACPYLLGTCIALSLPSAALAQEADILDVLGSERAVMAATGYNKPVRLAPSVATVITADDIQAIGATTLDQVLETVPGIHMSTSRDITSLPIIRGIVSELNADVLVLLNGIPYGQSLTNTFGAFDNFPVNNVARIEVLRGPVSALYGADAFAGVINIVTKTADDIHGTDVGALAGAFDTYEGWLLHGGRWGPFDVALGVTGRTTRGFEGTIEADAQTRLDRIFGTRASLAPASVDMERDIIDARLDVSSGPFRARAGYFGQRLGMGAGFLEALDPEGDIDIDRINADLSWQEKLSRPIELRALLSYYRNVNTLDTRLLPPGTFTRVLPGFPDGVLERLETTEQQWRGEVSTLYSGLEKHIFHAGLGYFHANLDNIMEERN